MDLSGMFIESHIKLELAARDKKSSLTELAGLLVTSGIINDEEKFMDSVFAREELGSTGIGDGIAIPHGKSSGVTKLAFAFGRSIKGIDFESLDGKPVNLLFLVASPLNQDTQYIKLLACLARLIKNPDFRSKLLTIENTSEAYMLISNAALQI